MAYKIGDKAHGGIVFDVDDSGEHGWVATETDQATEATWHEALEICSELEDGGYRDWVLPSKIQIDTMIRNLLKNGLSEFRGIWYWSSTEYDNDKAWGEFLMGPPSSGYNSKDSIGFVRPIRAF